MDFLRSFADIYDLPDNLVDQIRVILNEERSCFIDDSVNKGLEFLAEVPLSPKSGSNLSDLSSTFWSGQLSQRVLMPLSHLRHTTMIPRLDLNNLPLDSDEENKPSSSA